MNSNASKPNNVRSIEQHKEPLDDLAAIRHLLLRPSLEKHREVDRKLKAIQDQLVELDRRTEDCSQILAQSINTLHSQDKDLSQELEPEISAGVRRCFKNQTELMAEALYPVLGPAVRKMVASLFQGTDGNADRPYQIEQLFLIHKQTSLVLSEAALDPNAERDADLVSGMLDAIRSFVQEAFSLNEFDGMNSIKLGELTIWVEWGPKAILAVVVRGFADQSVQNHYSELLRLIHEKYESELEGFDGDVDSFSALDLAAVDANTAGDYRHDEPSESGKPVFTPGRLAVMAVVCLFLIANHVSGDRTWQGSLNALAKEPGVVVINAERGWFGNELSVLRDPLAASEDEVLRRARIKTDDVSVSWFRFQSQDSAIVARRTHYEILENNSSLNSRIDRTKHTTSTSTQP